MIKSDALKYEPVFTAFLSVSIGAELRFTYTDVPFHDHLVVNPYVGLKTKIKINL